jgi:hypothetical protein
MRYLLACLLVVAACGGSNDDAPPDAVRECNDSVAVFAAVNAECAVQTGQIAEQQRGEFVTNFKAGASLTLDCSRMTKVLGSPDTCATDMRALPCGLYDQQSGLPLAASCKGLYGK